MSQIESDQVTQTTEQTTDQETTTSSTDLSVGSMVVESSVPLETLREATAALENLNEYNDDFGWKFDQATGVAATDKVADYATFVCQVLEGRQTEIEGALEPLAQLIATEETPVIARTLAFEPQTFAGIDPENIARMKDFIHIPKDEADLRGDGLVDFSYARVELDMGDEQEVTIQGGLMTMKMHVSEDSNRALIDFVPTGSLNATHAFQGSLGTDLEESQKRQIKLDLTNSLITIAQGHMLRDDEGKQLMATTLWPGDGATAAYQKALGFDTITTDKTNQKFADYLHNKFGFSVEDREGRIFATITTNELVEALPKLYEAREKYLGQGNS